MLTRCWPLRSLCRGVLQVLRLVRKSGVELVQRGRARVSEQRRNDRILQPTEKKGVGHDPGSTTLDRSDRRSRTSRPPRNAPDEPGYGGCCNHRRPARRSRDRGRLATRRGASSTSVDGRRDGGREMSAAAVKPLTVKEAAERMRLCQATRSRSKITCFSTTGSRAPAGERRRGTAAHGRALIGEAP
jgi:hypothetical protein